MSILIKGNNGSGGSSGSSKGFPPGDVNIISKIAFSNKAYIRWSDPGDSVYDHTTLSTWKSTILVRNNDHYPQSIKDGTIVVTNVNRNKYKDNAFSESIPNNTTYYYRFFTMSTNKVYNDSNNMIFKIYNTTIDTTLKNNSWETISAISNLGVASSYWKIGDEISIPIDSYNANCVLQIWDFNHFDKIDRSGKAGIVFGMKNLLMSDIMKGNVGNYDESVAWNICEFRTTKIPGIEKCFPSDLTKYIIPVFTYTNNGPCKEAKATIDTLFLPSITEMGGTNSTCPGGISGEDKCTAFPIFNSNLSRVKYLNDVTYYYWTRTCSGYSTPAYYMSDKYVFKSYCCIDDEGEFTYREQNVSNTGFCICFNV